MSHCTGKTIACGFISSTLQMHGTSCMRVGSPIKTRHYNDIIMGTMASQITSLTIVNSIVYSDADQRKLAFVWGIHRGPVNSLQKWPVTQKMFPFDDVFMDTVQCRYNAVSFLRIPYKRHPIICWLGWGMGCLLWVQILIDILLQSLQWCIQYNVILDHVITAPDCSSGIVVDTVNKISWMTGIVVDTVNKISWMWEF